METVLIDTFTIPVESMPAFLERAQQMQRFIKTLPGFVEGFLYQKQSGASQHDVVTVAVWQNQEMFEAAKRAVTAYTQQQGIDPQASSRQLGVELVRSIYQRTPY